MEKIILDTNILIEISRNNLLISQKVFVLSPEFIYITPVIYAEFLRGVFNKEQLNGYEKFLKRFQILNSSPQSDQIFIELFDKYVLSHKPLVPDMQIAAIALTYQATLFTLNQKDFQYINGIKLY